MLEVLGLCVLLLLIDVGTKIKKKKRLDLVHYLIKDVGTKRVPSWSTGTE